VIIDQLIMQQSTTAMLCNAVCRLVHEIRQCRGLHDWCGR